MDAEYQQNKIFINLVLNKSSEIKTQIQIRRNHEYNEISQLILKSLHLQNNQNLRNFKKNGVEIFEDDFKYIKELETIYVSQGEDFNQESVLTEFETMRTLGEGGFGSVYLTRHRDTQELFAMKLVKINCITGI